MSEQVGIQVARMTFWVDWPLFNRTAAKYRADTTNVSDEQVETIIRLAGMFLAEFMHGQSWLLSVWGWLNGVVVRLGDDDGLEVYFKKQPEGRGVLELRIVNPDSYLILFAGTEVGCGIKDPDFDPVNDRRLPPDDFSDEAGAGC